MPDLPVVEWDRFENLSFRNESRISLLKGVDGNTGQDVGLRVASRMLEEVEKGRPEKEHKIWTRQLEEEAQNLYALEEAGLSVPRFIGSGITDGISTPLMAGNDSRFTYKIDNGLPFYAREWIKGNFLLYISFDELLRRCGDSLVGQAIDFGESFENKVKGALKWFNRSVFVLVDGSERIVHVGPNQLTERGAKSDLYTILDFLPRPSGLLLPIDSYGVEQAYALSLPEPYKSLIEDIKSGKFQNFGDLRKPVLESLQIIADQLGYAKDPATGLYRLKSEIPLLGQETHGLTGGRVRLVEKKEPVEGDWIKEQLSDPTLRPVLDSLGIGQQSGQQEPYTPLQRKPGKLRVNRKNRSDILYIAGDIADFFDDIELHSEEDLIRLFSYTADGGRLVTDTNKINLLYNRLWDVYNGLSPDRQRRIHPYLERLDAFVSDEPSFRERTYRFMKIGPADAKLPKALASKTVKELAKLSRFAKQHPSVVAAGAGLLVSESFSRDMSPLFRLEMDLMLSLGAATLNYIYAVIRSKDHDEKWRNVRKTMYLAIPTLVIYDVFLLTAANSAKYDQPPPNVIQPKQESVATSVQKESPRVVPMQTQDNLKYLGDKFTTSSIGSPRTGARCTVDNIGYDFSANPTLILGCGGSKILLGYSVGGRDQFSKIYQKLKGKGIEITRQPFGTYEDGFVYSADTIKVGNQTLFEYLK